MKNRFGEKVVIVTGGANGIGEATVRKFFSEGAKIAIIDTDVVSMDKLTQELDPSRTQIIGINCNIANREEVKDAFSKIMDKFGAVDVLVNNAGITRDAIFYKMTEEQWDQVIRVNGKGLFNCSQEAWLIMKANKSGKICNVSSTNSIGEVGQANYAFTKAGIEAFTKTLAREGGRYNINVNSVRPGVIDTDMMSVVPQDIIDRQIGQTAFRRMGKPSEVADAIAYLCSDEASWVTGVDLLVAGGYMYR